MRDRLCAVAGALIALTVCSAATPASATMVIRSDNGGRMREYAARFQQVRQSGERVVIDGICLSACTMVLGIVPPDRVCATRKAVFGFHAAWLPDDAGRRVTSAPATQVLMETYPPVVRAWIMRRGGLTPRMMFLRGGELAGIVAPCSSLPQQVARSRATSTRRVARGETRRVVSGDLRRTAVAARR